MKNNEKNNSMRGAIGVVALIIVILLIIGVGVYMYMSKTPAQKIGETGQTGTEAGTAAGDTGTTVSGIEVSVPDLVFSSSPLSDLKVSALNVSVAQIPTNNIFSAPEVNTDFSYKTDLNIPMPNPVINFQMPAIPANIPGNGNAPVVTPLVVIPSAPPVITPTPGPTGTAQPQVDCSQFSAVPACSYVGAPGSQGYESCKQCYPNK